MRALAVLSVMAYHVNSPWLPGGFIGVDVFFVVSGFVVSGSLAASTQASFPGFLADFYSRRLARIVPALVLVLVTTSIVATLFIPPAWLSTFSEQTALSAFLGLSNWAMQGNSDQYFAPRAEFNPYTHTWSLGVEEQFYLLCPLLLYLWIRARRRGSAGSRMMAAVATIATLSFVASIWAQQVNPAAAFFAIQFRLWELGAGVLLFQLSSAPDPSRLHLFNRQSALWEWIGLAMVVVSALFTDARHFPFPWVVPVVLGTVLMLGGVGGVAEGGPKVLLASKPAVWIGKRSYSLYLWHWPVFVLMRWTIGLDTLPQKLLAVLVAWGAAVVSYAIVERPLRHNRRIQALRPMLQIALFLVLIGAGRGVAQGVFARGERIGLSVVSRHRTDWLPEGSGRAALAGHTRCSVTVRAVPLKDGARTEYAPTGCTGTTARHKLFVLGDSHAEVYAQLLSELAAQEGVSVTLYTLPGCPYLILFEPMGKTQSPACMTFAHASSAHVLETAAAGDVVFLAGLRVPRLTDQWATVNADAVKSRATGAEVEQLRSDAMQEASVWLKPFADRGLHVVFEAPLPVFRAPPFRCSDWFNRRNPICNGGLTVSREYLQQLRAPVISTMERLQGALPRITIWDPFPIVCPADPCAPTLGGRPLFFDGDHLSGYGNEVLYAPFRDALSRLE